jgi:predicted transglutaminase-like cysteine proteinase
MYPNERDLEEVNFEINKGPYGPDPEHFDDWRPPKHPKEPRDCDSYATAKLWELNKNRGWPVGCLRLAMCYVEWTKEAPELKDRGHLVLQVTLPGNKVQVLDNRQKFPVTLAELKRIGYIPISIQRYGGSDEYAVWSWESKA